MAAEGQGGGRPGVPLRTLRLLLLPNKDEIFQALPRGSSRVNRARAPRQSRAPAGGPFPGLEGSVQAAVGSLRLQPHDHICTRPGGWCCRAGVASAWPGAGARAGSAPFFWARSRLPSQRPVVCQALPAGAADLKAKWCLWYWSRLWPRGLARLPGTAPSGSRLSGRFEVSMPSLALFKGSLLM